MPFLDLFRGIREKYQPGKARNVRSLISFNIRTNYGLENEKKSEEFKHKSNSDESANSRLASKRANFSYLTEITYITLHSIST